MSTEAAADLIIVGGGPAGIFAAIEARWHGLSVLLLDENAAPGGRIWQALEARGAKDKDDAYALQIVQGFRASGTEAHWRATVWAIEPDCTVYWSTDGATRSARGGFVLLATGTTERPVPIPGWTLSGVMTVGAAQIALKTAGLVPSAATWMAGQGPLLLLYAVQALRAGGRFAGVLDLSTRRAQLAALRHLPRAASAASELRKGLLWRQEIKRAGVAWISASEVRAEGDAALGRVRFRADGREHDEPADLLLHDGVIPSVQITRAPGLAHVWDVAQRCWKPVTDGWGVSSLPNLLVAGDGAGVGGALAAGFSGRLAALGAACALGRIDVVTRDAAAAPLRDARAASRAAAVPGCAARAAPCGARRCHAGLPLRGGFRREDPPGGTDRRAETEPAQGVHPLRHGAVPGPDVRCHGGRGDGRGTRRAGGADRAVAHPFPHQAADTGRTGRTEPRRLKP